MGNSRYNCGDTNNLELYLVPSGSVPTSTCKTVTSSQQCKEQKIWKGSLNYGYWPFSTILTSAEGYACARSYQLFHKYSTIFHISSHSHAILLSTTNNAPTAQSTMFLKLSNCQNSNLYMGLMHLQESQINDSIWYDHHLNKQFQDFEYYAN